MKHKHPHEHDCPHDHAHEHEEQGCGCSCGHDHGGMHGEEHGHTWMGYLLAGLSVGLSFVPILPRPLRIVLALIPYGAYGAGVILSMLRAMKRKKIFTEFTLMTVATLCAFALGEFSEGAAVMVLYSLGETLSEGAYRRSRKRIASLLEEESVSVTVEREGEILSLSPDEILVGDVMLVRTGERILLDGTVVSGGGEADTSSVTGEEKPRSLYEGVFCPSGSLLREGSVRILVAKEYRSSVATELRRAVEQAAKRLSPTERRITRFASVFTPIAFGVCALVFLAGTLLTGDFVLWGRVALSLLVVSCPCALVLSVPLAYFAGIGSAAARGIVFRGGDAMDALARCETAVFDKTGTLTEKELRFVGVEMFSELPEEDFLATAYEILLHSPHVAARAFCSAYGERDVRKAISIDSAENISGRGVKAFAQDRVYFFGNARLLQGNGIEAREGESTVIFGAWDGVCHGRLFFDSRIKNGAGECLGALRERGVRRTVLLSGDVEESVRKTAEALGISEYRAGQTPKEKFESVETLSKEQREGNPRATLLFCGDGLNDSAAIVRADVGVAMGKGGSALTVEGADVVLMDDDLQKLAEAIDVARRTSRVAGGCIALSLGIKLCVFAVSVLSALLFGGSVPMALAVASDVGSAVLAVFFALFAARSR